MTLLSHCANPVSPTGGPKDIIPPSVSKSTPPNNSINFKSKDVKLEFKEFVSLKDPNTQVTFSPPFLPNTDFKIRGKSIHVEFGDSLRTNTTYTINFGNSIIDITESNPLKNFTYVFSTGTYIDSLSYKGVVVDAFNLQPQKDVIAMMYVDENDTIPFDSLPCKVSPYYLSRTNENGEFVIRNLRDAPLKLFVLKDQNNDYIYNLPDEKIGFIDSLVRGIYQKPVIIDTLKKDSVEKSDTLIKPDLHTSKDSIEIQKKSKPVATIRLFQQFDSVQKLIRSTIPQESQIVLYFKYPLKNPRFNALNLADSASILEEHNRRNDTISLWLKNVNTDSLYLQIKDQEKIIDTLRLDLTKPKNKKSKKEEKARSLAIYNNSSGGSFNQYKSPLVLTFSYPLIKYNFSSILLVEEKDTLHPKIVLLDSIHRNFKINYKWKEDKKYKLIIPDSLFYSINNLSNDSILFGIKTRSEKEFGSFQLTVNISSRPGQYIFQLLDEKENFIEEKIVQSSEKIKFTYLNPKNYKIKVIFDRNKNGRWDTGNYFRKLQPEEVYYFPKTIEIRANWEIEETWDF